MVMVHSIATFAPTERAVAVWRRERGQGWEEDAKSFDENKTRKYNMRNRHLCMEA
jgi:hypothetical protein